ncbi:phosphoenolpyruvate carboxylase [Vulgatibacter sp.]|uniref:phosphoenolpyruvate carboxylase n=1 Tax=Vulgatibacter sp. TaxID=1971226 RepID=UPI003565B1BA
MESWFDPEAPTPRPRAARHERLLLRLLDEILAERGEGALREHFQHLLAAGRLPAGSRQATLRATIHRLSTSELEKLVRLLGLSLQLLNVAERSDLVVRLASSGIPRRASLEETFAALRERGLDAASTRRLVEALRLTLVFTAHPTQATRRSELRKLYRIASVLEEQASCRLSEEERARGTEAIRGEVHDLWLTDEVRDQRPTVGDEVKSTLWYLEDVFWTLPPRLASRIEEAFARVHGEPLGFHPAPLLLHSWVGSDMDGNPRVTAEVFEQTLRTHRDRRFALLESELRELRRSLSQSAGHLDVPGRLLRSIEEDARRFAGLSPLVVAHAQREPWRRKLAWMEARIVATRRDRAEGAYASSAELVADLDLVASTLEEAKAGAHAVRAVRELEATVRTMGFAIAESEVRVPAEDARDAVAFLARGEPPSDGARRLLDVLHRLAALQAQGGEFACRTLILSMAASARDIRDALACARSAGLWDDERGCATVDVVPLFETEQALDDGPAILEELFADEVYRRHVERRGVQEVMVGYSDSAKEVGFLAANAALRRALERMPQVAARAGVRLRLFHGRGQTVARGGGPAWEAIVAQPPGSVAGWFKQTEQGEALDQRFARPVLALRMVETLLAGALLHTAGAERRPGPDEEARWIVAFDGMAQVAREAYRGLVWSTPAFLDFFLAASPLGEIGELNIGSRPAKRKAGGLETLRAIPWVFAWNQNRISLPGWYGVGSALEQVAAQAGGLDELRAMYRGWPFFGRVLDNAEAVLAGTDFRVAARYARLASPELREAVWPRIREERRRTLRWLRAITGRQRLLEHKPELRRSLVRRRRFVEPLSWMQLELLRRKRAGEPGSDAALLLSIGALAIGLKATG